MLRISVLYASLSNTTFAYCVLFINKAVFLISKACSNATYGLDCIEKCWHCRDQRDCHHVNGSCLSGCEDGYRGDLCDSSKVCNTLVTSALSKKIVYNKA